MSRRLNADRSCPEATLAERDLYPSVERFLRRKLGCFHTAQNVGLGANRIRGNIDVVGLRHVGGDLRGDIEVIGCEVKDDEPFLKSAGQALAYGVMAHRCYLAAVDDFNTVQRRVAEHLGIGLMSISTGARPKCREVQSAPAVAVIPAYCDELVEQMGYVQCALCRSFFQASDERGKLMTSDHIVRHAARRTAADARDAEKGFAYWIDHAWETRTDERTQRRLARTDSIYDRRYLCASCLRAMLPE